MHSTALLHAGTSVGPVEVSFFCRCWVCNNLRQGCELERAPSTQRGSFSTARHVRILSRAPWMQGISR